MVPSSRVELELMAPETIVLSFTPQKQKVVNKNLKNVEKILINIFYQINKIFQILKSKKAKTTNISLI